MTAKKKRVPAAPATAAKKKPPAKPAAPSPAKSAKEEKLVLADRLPALDQGRAGRVFFHYGRFG